MKQNEIIKIMGQELGSNDLTELNKILRTDKSLQTKFKLAGKKLPALGYTVSIKAIVADGLKIFDVNKVSLIRYEDIETFAKAKPKVERPANQKKSEKAFTKKVGKQKTAVVKEEDSEAIPLVLVKFRKSPPGKGGSAFIPVNGPKKKK